MGRLDRSIKIAFDKVTAELLQADDIFDEKKDAFEIRRKYHRNELLLSCCECEQDLSISGSKYDRLHFKHKPGHDVCILTEGQLSPKDQDIFTEIHKSKESRRHKELKNKIGKLLANVEGVDTASIGIDSKFIIRNDEKRKPDVYCRYLDKELVFEIQLSALSLGYILSRNEFYKKNGMYLIWILDNFDIHNQGTLERDIKYLSKYENFFKLDETGNVFSLDCDYKISYLTADYKVHNKWLNKSVQLNQLKFDEESFQVYFFDFETNKQTVALELAEMVSKLEAEEEKKIAEERTALANSKAEEIIKTIKEYKARKAQNYTLIDDLINELDDSELIVLNNKLNLNNKELKKNPLNTWIKESSWDGSPFIVFILNCRKIDIDVNERKLNTLTLLQELYENKQLPSKYFIVKPLLHRGYYINQEDEAYLKKTLSDWEFLTFLFCKRLSDKDLVYDIFNFTKLICIIESAKQKQIIGYKFSNWSAFANNAIYHHKEYWEYIELAFKYYGLWDTLIASDKKNTFQSKVQDFYKNIPQQKFDFDEVFRDLYSDIIDDISLAKD